RGLEHLLQGRDDLAFELVARERDDHVLHGTYRHAVSPFRLAPTAGTGVGSQHYLTNPPLGSPVPNDAACGRMREDAGYRGGGSERMREQGSGTGGSAGAAAGGGPRARGGVA